LPHVTGNPGQIHQVVMNLCVNARDAMPLGGVLGLTLESLKLDGLVMTTEAEPISGNFVVLSVSDTGHGIPPEILRKIFEPFFTTKPEGTGTGLGLSTVRSIVRNHNGFVDVFSQPNKGTTFKILLPVTGEAEPARGHAAKTPPSGRGEMVLVVDDQLALSEIMRGTLESYNYRVLAAGNGAEALAVYQENKGQIRAIVMDMVAAGMDGRALLQNLRQIDQAIKIIGIVAMDPKSAMNRPEDFQLSALLTKPYTILELLNALHLVMEVKE
jgi:CheY-like chemotaxis protein